MEVLGLQDDVSVPDPARRTGVKSVGEQYTRTRVHPTPWRLRQHVAQHMPGVTFPPPEAACSGGGKHIQVNLTSWNR